MSKKAIDERFSEYLDASNEAVDDALKQLFPRLASWVPEPTVSRVKRIILKLLNQGLTVEIIKDKIAEALKDDLTFPGSVTDPVAFSQEIYELASLRWATKQGKEKGLLTLAGKQASVGQKFMNGRKQGALGVIRKFIQKKLSSNSELKNAVLWNALTELQPNYVAYDNHIGKYIEGPNGHEMTYATFCNVCAIVKKELKNSRFSEE